MSDHDKLREAVEFVEKYWCNHINQSEDGKEKFRLVAAAARSTLPRTKMVEVKLWAETNETGKVMAYGVLGEHSVSGANSCIALQPRRSIDRIRRLELTATFEVPD